MKQKLKKEYIVLAVVIVVLCLYLVFKPGDKVHYDVPELKPVIEADIDKIEITRKGKTITLTKQEGKWLIGENNYPMDATRIEKILESTAGLSLSDMVSESKNYAPYELDEEKRVLIKAYGQDKVLRDFVLGKQASTFNHTFVKIAGDDRVFYARKSLRGYFDREIDDMRDKQVLKFDKNEISEILVATAEQEYLFTKKVTTAEPNPAEEKDKEKEQAPPAPAKDEVQWVTEAGKEGDKSKIDSFINQLSDMKCDSFYADKEIKDFAAQKPVLALTLTGSKSYKLSIFEKLPEGGDNVGKFPAVSSENLYPFLLVSYKGDNFIRDAKELVKEEKETPVKEKKPVLKTKKAVGKAVKKEKTPPAKAVVKKTNKAAKKK